MPRIIADLSGTNEPSIRIGPKATGSTLDASGLTAPRTHALPDASGTLATSADLSALAPLASPAFTGVPTAPTAAADTSTTQIATTAFAKAEADAAQAASDPAGSAAAAQAAAASDATTKANAAQAAAIAASDPAGAAAAVLATSAQKAANLSDLANAATARTNLGLGTAATQASTAFDPAGSAAAAQAASDPVGSAAAAQAAAVASSAQRASNLSDLANAGTARTNLGLGGAAVLNVGVIAGTVAAGDDARLSDARTPTAHAASHVAAGSDPLTLSESQITGLTAALAAKATDSLVVHLAGTETISGAKTLDSGSGTLPAALPIVGLRISAADGVGTAIQADSFAATGIAIAGRQAGGTRASPSATASGANLVSLLAYGYDVAHTTSPSARFIMRTGSTWSATNRETDFAFVGTPSGSTTASTWAILNGAGLTLNATTDATNTTTGAISTPGGISAAKSIYSGGSMTVDLAATEPVLAGTTTTGLSIRGADTGSARITLSSYNSVNGCFVRGLAFSGTRAAPTAAVDGHGLVHIQGQSYDGTAAYGNTAINQEADGAQTAGNHGGKILFYQCYSGTTSFLEVVRIKDGNLSVVQAGKGLTIAEGTNAKMGVATLVAGTVTVNTTAVSANSRIFLTAQNASGTHGEVGVSARVAGTSFTITSASGTDTRDIAWMIVDPTV